MSSALDAIPESEVDRLRELAHIGASWAATAFARLVGRTILTRVPVVHGPDRFRRRGEWHTGVMCEISGELDGLVAIFLPLAVRDSLTARLCAKQGPSKEMVASLLTELGSILTSQTVSAIADTLGGRIMPGLPELVLENAEEALQARLSPRHRPPPPLYIESELFDRQGEFRLLHVVLPQVPKAVTRAR